MNRTFKFRVWDKPTKTWWKTLCGLLFYPRVIGNAKDATGIGDLMGLEKQSDKFVAVTQFTGLLDKNGREIYEGDIVSEFVEDKEGDYIKKSVVEFVNGGFLIDATDCGTLLSLYHNHIEVIGNIFENPEFLS